MKLGKLTFLAFQVNGAVDSGKHSHVSFEDVAAHLDAGTIFKYLQETIEYFDVSIVTEAERTELTEEWYSLWNAVDAHRKFCVDNNGLCLLVAYMLEGIQTRARALEI